MSNNKLNFLLSYNALPIVLIKFFTRFLIKKRYKELTFVNIEEQELYLQNFITQQKKAPLAVNTKEANEQHYELPSQFFELVLGKHLKYSSALFPKHSISLDLAEQYMLDSYIQKADIQAGMSILDLGCGWGSLSLYIAQKYPKCNIIGVSNSKSQKDFIDKQSRIKRIKNLKILTQDINKFSLNKKFDRVVSIEMFEHLRNYKKLFSLISLLLKPQGKLFFHIFTHKDTPYLFEVKDQFDWMSKYFFTGGMMPSSHLPFYFNNDLKVTQHWKINGQHYAQTSKAWLKNMDINKKEILTILNDVYHGESKKWFTYWKIFFIACEELFKFKQGNEWFVSHYLMEKNR